MAICNPGTDTITQWRVNRPMFSGVPTVHVSMVGARCAARYLARNFIQTDPHGGASAKTGPYAERRPAQAGPA